MGNAEGISYYEKYRAAARRFEAIGAALLAAGALWRFVAGGGAALWISIIVGGIGLCILAAGAASLRPHNIVKSFALQCAQQPQEGYARGLLDALTAQRRLHLTMRSIRLTEGAILAYARSDGANKELAERLAAALHERVVKKAF